MDATIEAEGLEKSYGKVRALEGIDLSAREGTILGLLISVRRYQRTVGR